MDLTVLPIYHAGLNSCEWGPRAHASCRSEAWNSSLPFNGLDARSGPLIIPRIQETQSRGG